MKLSTDKSRIWIYCFTHLSIKTVAEFDGINLRPIILWNGPFVVIYINFASNFFSLYLSVFRPLVAFSSLISLHQITIKLYKCIYGYDCKMAIDSFSFYIISSNLCINLKIGALFIALNSRKKERENPNSITIELILSLIRNGCHLFAKYILHNSMITLFI